MRAPRPCPACGTIFEPHRAGRKWTVTCGAKACVSEMIARGQRGARVDLLCEVCGKEWSLPPGRAFGRRTCSHGCAAVVKRREASDRRGAANPNFRHGQRAGVRDREGEARWHAGEGRACENPDCLGSVGRIAAHHCVYRQAIQREGGDVWDPRNRMMLCAACHGSHHRGGRVLRLAVLPASVIEFAFDTLGPGAGYEYLRRRYAGPDPRLAMHVVSGAVPSTVPEFEEALRLLSEMAVTPASDIEGDDVGEERWSP